MQNKNSMDYFTEKICTYEQLPDAICQHCGKAEKGKWIFRGNKPESPLFSSLDRAYSFYPSIIKSKFEAEQDILREFKRRYHQYSANIPANDDTLEWFSIMQHYGAPTRLLDFTYSPYIALYFALEYAEPDNSSSNSSKELKAELYAINANWAIEQSVENHKNRSDYKIAREYFNKLIGNTASDRKKFNKFFISKKAKTFACPFNPYRLCERISIQNGVFICPGNVTKSFDENIAAMEGWSQKENIIKFDISLSQDVFIQAK